MRDDVNIMRRVVVTVEKLCFLVVILFFFFFFFFQAEDGIRDRTVTGVQTCALPISLGAEAVAYRSRRISRAGTTRPARSFATGKLPLQHREEVAVVVGPGDRRRGEIGRASCRERGEGGVVGERGTKKKGEGAR